MIVNWWPPFGINFYIFANVTSRYGHHCIDMTGGRQLVNGVTAHGCHALQRMIGWELSRTCIVTSWSRQGNQKHSVLADRRGRLAMLTEENSTSKYNVNMMKICKCKEKGLKILARWDPFSNSVPFFLESSSPLNCTFTNIFSVL